MARECAFCPATAKLSAEHLWSEWMDELFPGEKKFFIKDEHGQVLKTWVSGNLDWKAKVVCRDCNNTWMSAIEQYHARPAMSPLMTGDRRLTISAKRAASVALFAFKAAIVLDHAATKRDPFLEKSLRYHFRESLAIPDCVHMWMAGYTKGRSGEVITLYHEAELSPANRLRLYVCTYAVGHLVIQIGLQRQSGSVNFEPRFGEQFESLSIPFWPRLPRGTSWPLSARLRGIGEFEEYAARWRDLTCWNSSAT